MDSVDEGISCLFVVVFLVGALLGAFSLATMELLAAHLNIQVHLR